MSNSTDNMASELPEVQEGALAHPAGESGEESAAANPIGQRELPLESSEIPWLTSYIIKEEIDGLDQSNIIEDGSERSAKPTDFKGDEQLDAQVEEVAKNDGTSSQTASFDDRAPLTRFLRQRVWHKNLYSPTLLQINT